VYFNVNFNVFFKIKCAFVGEWTVQTVFVFTLLKEKQREGKE